MLQVLTKLANCFTDIDAESLVRLKEAQLMYMLSDEVSSLQIV